MKGVIGGKQVTHDVDAAWLLNREYLQMHEVSRETRASGEPSYEAIVIIGWDTKSQRYACLWLDTTGGDGLRSEAIAHATRTGDSLPFIFRISSSELLRTTFKYSSNSDTWQVVIDDETNGKAERFADLELRRTRAEGSGR
jgi:hypothetical protein